ncbi:NAD(P)-dependent oxidoreductase [Phyllobacterium sp. YR531]|uniref:NAD(P)-dependent oxidoreductase n=1 Tax=Phyllobacterium sp. YR531 TaxID=1144343 RepID=UPI00026F644C|nr:NAD(P)-dependent oxidoreductase [Phyllobacterium sp. YR531]EJN02554.1 siroheme synthase containing protein [Phyllobacterium sp. YR531]
MMPRVSHLAKLPIFWNLEGQRVIVAGGSDAAAWKAELLAACGAVVHIHADTLSDSFTHLVCSSPGSKRPTYIHHARACTIADLAGASLAVGDFENENDARLFLDAGIAAGVPVNIIDKPAFCQFQFGSIVNRSPVIVSISTDGASPILAQAIRRRIEAILPDSLQLWAAMAQSLRGKINEWLETGQSRRRFWEGFVDRVFAGAPDERALPDLLAAAAKGGAPAMRCGKITFVLAGPGDPELLTLKAIRALQAADVVLYGARIPHGMLELARREALRLTADQSAGKMVDRIVGFLGKGKNIVRMELSDPAGNRRLRDEIYQLDQIGVEGSVVPGLPAGRTEIPFRARNTRTSLKAGIQHIANRPGA